MDDAPSLHQKTLAWLEKQGYPLEMKVASQLRAKTKFQVRQGWYYTDSESNQSREIDVVATASDDYGYATIHFAIECKATSKPWVLFTSTYTTENYNRILAFAFCSKDARDALSDALFPVDDQAISLRKELPWMWDRESVGYALVQAFEGNSDAPFAATSAAVKAALHCFASSPEHNSPPPLIVSFPVVVTASPLFECSLGDDGSTQLREIDRGFLFYQRRIGALPPTTVAIVTEKGLGAYIDECIAVSKSLIGFFGPAINKRWEEAKRG
jgi:hypothetical protein